MRCSLIVAYVCRSSVQTSLTLQVCHNNITWRAKKLVTMQAIFLISLVVFRMVADSIVSHKLIGSTTFTIIGFLAQTCTKDVVGQSTFIFSFRLTTSQIFLYKSCIRHPLLPSKSPSGIEDSTRNTALLQL